jgi:hypothetical protein
MNNQLWSLRQNPYANTDQTQMRKAILENNFVSCPFGHISVCRNNLLDGRYNTEANKQDVQFIEDMKIGDIVLIPFKGQKACILAKIVSDPVYCIETGLYTSQKAGEQIKISHSDAGGEPFRPVGRRIEILNSNVVFTDKRKFIPMNTFKRLSARILQEVLLHLE